MQCSGVCIAIGDGLDTLFSSLSSAAESSSSHRRRWRVHSTVAALGAAAVAAAPSTHSATVPSRQLRRWMDLNDDPSPCVATFFITYSKRTAPRCGRKEARERKEEK